jgi:hypothetical protein
VSGDKDFYQHEREQAARDVLWSVRDKRGYQPGGFTETLLLAWGRADMDNKYRLAIAFPALGKAMYIVVNEGSDALAEWAGIGTSSEISEGVTE